MARFGQQFLAGLLQPSYQQGMFQVGQQLGAMPAQRRQLQKAEAQRQQLSQIDTQTPQGLLQLAQFYRQQGDVENAVKYEEAARTLQTQLTAETNLKARKTSLATTATALKMPDLATRIEGVTDADELKEIAKEIRQTERDKMPTQSPLVRKRMANAAGISPDQFDELD